MTTPHRIHLRSFWEQTPLAGGGVRYFRRVGCPRSLADGETLWLVCDHVSSPARVFLNEQPLGEADRKFSFEITGLLQPRNSVAIEMTGAEALGMVVIEVHPAE